MTNVNILVINYSWNRNQLALIFVFILILSSRVFLVYLLLKRLNFAKQPSTHGKRSIHEEFPTARNVMQSRGQTCGHIVLAIGSLIE